MTARHAPRSGFACAVPPASSPSVGGSISYGRSGREHLDHPDVRGLPAGALRQPQARTCPTTSPAPRWATPSRTGRATGGDLLELPRARASLTCWPPSLWALGDLLGERPSTNFPVTPRPCPRSPAAQQRDRLGQPARAPWTRTPARGRSVFTIRLLGHEASTQLALAGRSRASASNFAIAPGPRTEGTAPARRSARPARRSAGASRTSSPLLRRLRPSPLAAIQALPRRSALDHDDLVRRGRAPRDGA